MCTLSVFRARLSDLSVCFSIEGERATVVRQLQRDVDMTEQATLQALEDGAAPDGDDAALAPADAAPASSEEASGGVVAQGAAQRS